MKRSRSRAMPDDCSDRIRPDDRRCARHWRRGHRTGFEASRAYSTVIDELTAELHGRSCAPTRIRAMSGASAFRPAYQRMRENSPGRLRRGCRRLARPLRAGPGGHGRAVQAVQPCNRQQAARQRCGCASGRRWCTERVCCRSLDDAAKKGRPARRIWVDGADAAISRRLHQNRRQEARRRCLRRLVHDAGHLPLHGSLERIRSPARATQTRAASPTSLASQSNREAA